MVRIIAVEDLPIIFLPSIDSLSTINIQSRSEFPTSQVCQREEEAEKDAMKAEDRTKRVESREVNISR